MRTGSIPKAGATAESDPTMTGARPRKRSLTLRGHPTSVSLEDAFWTAFREIAAIEPDRCVLVEAAAGIEDVEAAVWAAVSSRLQGHG